MDNVLTLEGTFIGSYVNKKKITCMKLINKCSAIEFGRPVDLVNDYFTVKVTNDADIKKIEGFEFGARVSTYCHLKQEVTLSSGDNDRYETAIYADNIFEETA